MQAQHVCLWSQRTGAEPNRLDRDLNDLDFAMELGPARIGIERLSRSKLGFPSQERTISRMEGVEATH